jgi:NAD(P)-dependent dehydrogenase (short-subunit alcohol dehydrogenase family)
MVPAGCPVTCFIENRLENRRRAAMSWELEAGPLAMDKTKLKRGALAGEVAVVTGAAGNVGLGTARSLAWLGARVVLADVFPEPGKAAEALINKENTPGTAAFVETDVADEASMKAMAGKAIDTFGKVDILVNNAMDMSMGAPILKTTIKQLDRQYEIAARGTLIGINLFLPGMQERRHGVLVYSATAFMYPPGPANYCAAKAAATSIMMSLSNELGPVEESGIAAFCFIPAGVGFPRSGRRPAGGEPRPAPDPRMPVYRVMPGYDGMIPPEDGGAALAYCITRAEELHGSGVTVQQALRQMEWPFPRPDTAQATDFERIDDRALTMVFSIMGPGFRDPKTPLRPIKRS